MKDTDKDLDAALNRLEAALEKDQEKTLKTITFNCANCLGDVTRVIALSITLFLVSLKLFNVVEWSWQVVLSPLLVWVSFYLGMMFFTATLALYIKRLK